MNSARTCTMSTPLGRIISNLSVADVWRQEQKTYLEMTSLFEEGKVEFSDDEPIVCQYCGRDA